MRHVRLTAEERFALAESVEYSIDAVKDLLLVEHRTSEERHRAARTAVAVAHAVDGMYSGVLDVDAPHVREWLMGERKLCADYAREQAGWLRELRGRLAELEDMGTPACAEGREILKRKREISDVVDEALAQVRTCDRLLQVGGSR